MILSFVIQDSTCWSINAEFFYIWERKEARNRLKRDKDLELVEHHQIISLHVKAVFMRAEKWRRKLFMIDGFFLNLCMTEAWRLNTPKSCDFNNKRREGFRTKLMSFKGLKVCANIRMKPSCCPKNPLALENTYWQSILFAIEINASE